MKKVLLLLFFPILLFSEITSETFNNYFSNNKNVMLFINPSNGNIIKANNAAKKFYGYTNLTNMSIQQINTFTKEQVQQEMKKAKGEQRNYFIFNHRLFDGSTQKVRVFAHPIEFNNKKILYSTIYPMLLEKEFIDSFNTTLEKQVELQSQELKKEHKKTTTLLIAILIISLGTILVLLFFYRYKAISQKEIEKQNKAIKKEHSELETQKERLELVLSGTGLGLWDWNPQTNDVVFDERWANMLGYKLSEVTPSLESWQSKVHPDDIAKCFEDIQAHMNGEVDLYNNVHRMMHKDGKWRYILDRGKIAKRDKDGNPIRFTGTHTDITHIKETEIKLQEKQYKIDQYVNLIDKHIITSSTDLNGKIKNVSEAFCKVSGYSKEELIGRNHNITKHPNMDPKVHSEIWQAINKNETWQGEIMNLNKHEDTYWVKATISPEYDEDGSKIGYTSIRQDITDKKIIEEISITDGLTNIFNRRHFNEIFPIIINSAKRDNELVSFLIMDIDHFKQYNDTYGHQMGDNVLIKVAESIKTSLHRADDYCFRLGGEEFGIIFKSESKDKAKEFANKILQNIEKLQIEHSQNSASNYITISGGLICKNANDVKDANEIYKEADDLLYKAKEISRNRVEIT